MSCLSVCASIGRGMPCAPQAAQKSGDANTKSGPRVRKNAVGQRRFNYTVPPSPVNEVLSRVLGPRPQQGEPLRSFTRSLVAPDRTFQELIQRLLVLEKMIQFLFGLSLKRGVRRVGALRAIAK